MISLMGRTGSGRPIVFAARRVGTDRCSGTVSGYLLGEAQVSIDELHRSLTPSGISDLCADDY